MYIFEKGEPAILVEIFLPYKAKYQGALYRVLEEGLLASALKDGCAPHFTGAEQFRIKRLLRNYGIPDDFNGFLARDAKIFTGYSTYEVHGVFSSSKPHEPLSKPIEEQTTVIRIIFVPNYNQMLAEISEELPDSKVDKMLFNNLFRILLQNNYSDSSITPVIEKTGLGKDYQALSPEVQQYCIKVIKNWVDDVGIFLFGYIVFKIADGVEEEEEEIWVTSHWNFYVNRITRESSYKQ